MTATISSAAGRSKPNKTGLSGFFRNPWELILGTDHRRGSGHAKSRSRRLRLGLALSSGGAKGLAHVGVLQVLEEHGIEPDIVVGSSMGAYVGAIWASGANGEEMLRLANDVRRLRSRLSLLDPVLPPRQGFIRGHHVLKRLRATLGDATFESLPRMLRVVATDIETLERVVFDSGDVAKAVHASIAIPGVVVPVLIDGRRLVDGGIADPLPVDILLEMGVDRIIAVNTIPTPQQIRQTMATLTPSESRTWRRRAAAVLGLHLNYFSPGNLLDNITRAIHGVQTRVAEESCKSADVVIRPVACDSRWHDFGHPERYVELGRAAALDALPAIFAMLKRRPTDIPSRTESSTASPHEK
jgi:NTE family protein